MPTKSTKTTKKSELKKTKSSETKSSTKLSEKKIVGKKDLTKKVVVKRRKVDLVPTKASAVAIASQANRAKKKALIEKVATSGNITTKMGGSSTDTRIPLWVRIVFGCSLLLFCVSFYQAIIRPQIIKDNIVMDDSNNWFKENVENEGYNQEIEDNVVVSNEDSYVDEIEKDTGIVVPKTATDMIAEFFSRMSNRDFDGAFDLMIPALRNYGDIRTHFTSFRMEPFLNGIEGGKLVPMNFEYVNSPAYGKDVYRFDLSYVMISDQSKYEETWEFTVNTSGDEPKISSIRCISSKCSYHPIFWPENFGLMR